MKLTLRQLEYILAIEETGQFNLAARKLHVAQPSLSAQIAELEAAIGEKLFIRNRKGAVPTPLGLDVIKRARHILKETEELKAMLGGREITRLSIGVLPSIGPYLLPPVVRKLHKAHPNLRLVVREGSTAQLDALLRQHQVDMIISTSEDHPLFPKQELFTEALWAACASDLLDLSGQQQIQLKALAGLTFLTLERGHRLSHIVQGMAEQAGGYVSDEYAGTSLDAIRVMAATGAGVAILPDIYALSEAARGRDIQLARINHKQAERKISLIFKASLLEDEKVAILANLIRGEHNRIVRP